MAKDIKWEYPVCPICKTVKYLKPYYTEITTWEYPGEFNYSKCVKCGLIMQSPRVIESQVGQYYQSKTYWGKDITTDFTYPDFKKDRQKYYGNLYREIFKKKKPGKILDVGSGLGLFLSKFKDEGWETLGTEISNDISKFARKVFGVEMRVGLLKEIVLPTESFDVVVFSGVFEHLYGPSETLEYVHKLLKKDGLLVIVPPNIESLGHMIFRKRWFSLEPGRHVFHYSPQTIAKLLKKSGFTVEKISHDHFLHNFYSLYSNIRYLFSPKFSMCHRPRKNNLKFDLQLVITPGKLLAKLFALTVSVVEPIVGRGESMVVYAQKD